jgi:hypothetical protein
VSRSGKVPRLRGHITMAYIQDPPSTTSSERSKNVITLVKIVFDVWMVFHSDYMDSMRI